MNIHDEPSALAAATENLRKSLFITNSPRFLYSKAAITAITDRRERSLSINFYLRVDRWLEAQTLCHLFAPGAQTECLRSQLSACTVANTDVRPTVVLRARSVLLTIAN
jgi:hypothetical protein